MNGFGGFRVMHGEMTFNPWIPEEWDELTFSIRWRGSKLNVRVGHDNCRFLLEGAPDASETVMVGDQRFTLTGGVEQSVPLS